MATEKYYTPTIEEFHVGFEYEVDHGEDRWMQNRVRDKSLSFSFYEDIISQGRMRIKYLDEEDILAEGWNKITDTEFAKNLHGQTYVIDILGENKFGIIAGKDVRAIAAHDYSTLFYGTIRNRGELRQIMKMIGIN